MKRTLLALAVLILLTSESPAQTVEYAVGDAADAIWLTMNAIAPRKGVDGFDLVGGGLRLVEDNDGEIPAVGYLNLPAVEPLGFFPNETAIQTHLSRASGQLPKVGGKSYFFARFGRHREKVLDDVKLVYIPVIAVDRRYVDFKDIPVKQLAYGRQLTTPTLEAYDVVGREMHKWAGRHGYLTAVPTGEAKQVDGEHFFGAALLKKEACDLQYPNFTRTEESKDLIILPTTRYVGWGTYLNVEGHRIQSWAKEYHGGRAAFVVKRPGSLTGLGKCTIAVFKPGVAKVFPMSVSAVHVVSSPNLSANAKRAAEVWYNRGLALPPYNADHLNAPKGTKQKSGDGNRQDSKVVLEERKRLLGKFKLGAKETQ